MSMYQEGSGQGLEAIALHKSASQKNPIFLCSAQ